MTILALKPCFSSIISVEPLSYLFRVKIKRWSVDQRINGKHSFQRATGYVPNSAYHLIPSLKKTKREKMVPLITTKGNNLFIKKFIITLLKNFLAGFLSSFHLSGRSYLAGGGGGEGGG